MKRLFSAFFILFFIGMLTDAFALAGHLTRELKCPRCKMKIEKKNGCPCHKKKATPNPVIHDPCGDDEGDFHVGFDRFQNFRASADVFLTSLVAVFEFIQIPTYTGIPSEIPHPPPRR